jgi:hypothetical protein
MFMAFSWQRQISAINKAGRFLSNISAFKGCLFRESLTLEKSLKTTSEEGSPET